jgi:hypothetical protein
MRAKILANNQFGDFTEIKNGLPHIGVKTLKVFLEVFFVKVQVFVLWVGFLQVLNSFRVGVHHW